MDKKLRQWLLEKSAADQEATRMQERGSGQAFGGWWYCAIGSRVAVRMPTDEPDDMCERGQKLMLTLAWPAEGDAEFAKPWPEPDVRDNRSVCNHRCPTCKGTGEVECYHCGHDMECDECEGVGRWPKDACERCGGTGKIGDVYYRLPEGDVLGSVWDVIAGLPNPRYLTPTDVHKPVAGFFDGGQFVFMLRAKGGA